MNNRVAIIGGGPWGSLLAYRLSQLRPEIDFTLYERDDRLGGQHTWSFHGSDISEDDFNWLKPFITKSWDAQEVIFPGHRRLLSTSYHAIRSEQLDARLQEHFTSHQLKLNRHIEEHDFAELGDVIFDARGIVQPSLAGYQKFLGLDVRLASPHGLTVPLIMDAQVPQLEGYRFIYLLPWTQNTLMIEDTRYSLQAGLNLQHIERDLLGEIEKRGWVVESIIRREQGHLPIPLKPVAVTHGSAINLAGIFHDTTGYSLPHAVKLINRLVKLKSFDRASVKACVESYRQEWESTRAFYRLVNLLLFKAAPAHESYRMLQHFYGLPQNLIERFYAGELSWSDKMRFFLGRPPVSVLTAARLLIHGGQE